MGRSTASAAQTIPIATGFNRMRSFSNSVVASVSTDWVRVQVGHRLLAATSLDGGREHGPLVVLEHLEPRGDVGGVILADYRRRLRPCCRSAPRIGCLALQFEPQPSRNRDEANDLRQL